MDKVFDVKEAQGVPLTTQKITPGDVATGIGSNIYQYIERELAFTSGGTTQIVVGDLIVGASSGAYAQVIAVSAITGTWAGGDAAGTFTIRGQVGTFQSENIKVAAGTNDATIAANSTESTADYPYKNKMAQTALITFETFAQRVSLNGVKTDSTSKIGMNMAAGTNMTLSSEAAIQGFRTVDAASGSAGTVRVTCFF